MRKRMTMADVANALYRQPTASPKAAMKERQMAFSGLVKKPAADQAPWVSRLGGVAQPSVQPKRKA